ncbi:MAG: DUF3048 domain-containing protein [Actinobacteria bacterium]|uniref:Unannotated protein n=2 Tax=freshwater metagenome TaxID=449393 RepID=A0A6J7BSM9_9ZZZZ|nr:DUF3048 domain-containing protein [Actinomycetota bacterium]MSX54660.1 DUF3048 domain-containing protein [Actinomycetota bacterium]MSX92513.1 DUF3048 domain-containing protein [Actinomycetota bacterium]
MRSPSSLRARLSLGIVLVAATALAACSSDSSSKSTAETLPLSTLPATVASTTPPAVTDAPTTAATQVATYPLTGLPVSDEAAAARPAMIAKVGNYDSYPQTGLNAADIVYEELINDHISRFAIVYQSQAPKDLVGPIRSGRRQDVDLLTNLNHPVLAWAGGNAFVTKDVADSELVNMSQTYCNKACMRVDFTKAPYNLYFDIAKAWEKMPEGGKTPPQQFQYRTTGAALAGSAATGVDMTIDSYKIGWTWNDSTKQYERTQNKKADTERNGDRVTTENVLILKMVYKFSVGSPAAQSVGSGEAFLFTGGNMVHGTWSRADNHDVYTLTADDGSTFLLTPGRTFVELPRKEDIVTPK